jgi:hypothetical protein
MQTPTEVVGTMMLPMMPVCQAKIHAQATQQPLCHVIYAAPNWIWHVIAPLNGSHYLTVMEIACELILLWVEDTGLT